MLLLQLTLSYSSPVDYHSVHVNVSSDKCMKPFARYKHCEFVSVGHKRLESSVITDSNVKLQVLSSKEAGEKRYTPKCCHPYHFENSVCICRVAFASPVLQ